jgi:uncharacterized protein
MDRVAVVTGASSGIGAAYARRLAAQGYSLLLVARRRALLESLAGDLAARHGVRVEVLPADLTDRDALESVARATAALDRVDLVVSCAGFGTWGPLAAADPTQEQAMVALHVGAPIRLAQAALPGMLERGRGAIVSVASLAAFLPMPDSVTYCATKRALVTFSQALSAEVRGRGVRVQALCPGFTRSQFHDTEAFAGNDPRARVPGFLWMTADQVVDASLDALARGKVVCVPGRLNQAIVLAARLGLLGWAARLTRRSP